MGTHSIVVPDDWTVHEEPNAEGYSVIDAPGGDGRILLLNVEAQSPPATIDEAYAAAHGRDASRSIGLDGTNLDVRQGSGEGHYFATESGVVGGATVSAAAHVWPPGHVVVGVYHSDTTDDPHLAAAERILRSVLPGPPP